MRRILGLNDKNPKMRVAFRKCIGLFGCFLLLTMANIKGQTNTNLSNLLSFDGEPSVAINPSNPSNIIAAWMRLRADGKIWIASKATFDAGQTWSAINFMPHDTVTNGSADVSIAFHNSGMAYMSYIDFRTNPDTAGVILLSRSTDGGLSWENPSHVYDMTDSPDLPIDRPWIAIDNSGGANDGTIYVTSMSAYWVTGQHHIYLRSSDNGGQNWSNISAIDTIGFSVGVLSASYAGISVGSDGKAYIAFLSYDTTVSPFVRYYCATTADKGLHFDRNVIGNASISGGSDFTRAWCLKANPAINGSAALTWIDNRNGDYDVMLSKTSDAGQNWSSPIRINDDPIGNGIEQDMVWADYSPSGNFVAAWRDRRLNGIGNAVPFDIFAAFSIDNLNSFSQNNRITSVSSPYFNVPQGNSFIGLSMSDSAFAVTWGDYRNDPDWDIFFNHAPLSLANSTVASNHTLRPQIQMHPNPASIFAIYEAKLLENFEDLEGILFNEMGEIVLRSKPELDTHNQAFGMLDISNLPKGIYFFFLKSKAEYLANQKLVIY